jgi:peptidoglycan/LPS O-acetylase OafA/YrhL
MLNRLTGVRAVAAIFVVFFHFGDSFATLFPPLVWLRPLYKSGDMGVDLFFLLSGFILSLNYLDKLKTFSRRNYFNFLGARLARIYPVHIFTLLLLTAFVLYAWHFDIKMNLAHYSGFTWATNVFLIQVWPGFNRGLTWNFPSWSISAEWFAYLLFPFFAITIAKNKRPFVWGSLALMLYTVPSLFGLEQNSVRWALLRVSSEFLAGCFLFCIYRSGIACPIRPWLSGLGCISICAVGSYFNVSRALSLPFFALLIWGLATYSEGFLSGRIAVYWGKVSYALYMTHGLCQIVLNRAIPTEKFRFSSFLLRAEIAVAYSLPLIFSAVLVYHFVEMPARQWLHPSSKKKPLTVSSGELLQTSTKESAGI